VTTPDPRAVAVVDAGLPDPTRSAGERATVDLVDALVARGDAVTLVGLGRDPLGRTGLATDLAARGARVHPTVGPDAVAAVLDAQRCGVVFVQRPGPMVRVAPVLAARPGVAVVHCGHDRHAERLGAEATVLGTDPRRARLLAVVEQAAWRAADVTTYPSETEAAGVPAAGRARAVPYYRLGRDDLDRGTGAARDRRGILMVGGAAHAPNHDAVAWVAAELLSRLRAVGIDDPVTVVGEWPVGLRPVPVGGLRFTGRVDEAELRALHHEHRLLLAPLRFGAGAKRKLVAAMGLGLPVVTTPVGGRGLLVRDAGPVDGVTVAAGTDDLVAAVRALDDPVRWRASADAAHAAVVAVYGTDPYDRAVAETARAAVAAREERCGSTGRGEIA
jgi:glycosyltransferase involved in cell wall biosynthesis